MRGFWQYIENVEKPGQEPPHSYVFERLPPTRQPTSYKPDAPPDPSVLQVANRAISEIKSQLLPQLGVWPDFTVHFVKGLRAHLGKYLNGSYTSPVFVLDLNRIKKSSDQYGVDYHTAVETTLTHELAHAVQEWLGLSMDEHEAENFARTWYETRTIAPFRRPKLASAVGKWPHAE